MGFRNKIDLIGQQKLQRERERERERERASCCLLNSYACDSNNVDLSVFFFKKKYVLLFQSKVQVFALYIKYFCFILISFCYIITEGSLFGIATLHLK